MNQAEIPVPTSLQYELPADLGQFRQKVWHSVMIACGVGAIPYLLHDILFLSVNLSSYFDVLRAAFESPQFTPLLYLAQTVAGMIFVVSCLLRRSAGRLVGRLFLLRRSSS